MAERTGLWMPFDRRFQAREPLSDPVPHPGVPVLLIHTQILLQVLQDSQIIERVNVARDQLRDCPDPGAFGCGRW